MCLMCCPLQLGEDYTAKMESQVLPVEIVMLESQHKVASEEALRRFDREKFGTETGASAGKLRWPSLSLR